MKKNYQNIIVEKEGAIGRLILNRPDKLNCMSPGLLKEFGEACFDFRDDPEIKVFIIKGTGRAFCAGYDMSFDEPRPYGDQAIDWLMRDPHPDDLFTRTLWENPKIIIGQVHSFCLAGGGNMASHMDIVYCSDDALFGYPPARYASPGSHQLWPVLVGLRKAMEHLCTGNMMPAQEAHRVGFINEVFPKDRLEQEVERLAKTIAKLPMAALFVNKRAVHEWYECMGIRTALRHSALLRNISYGSSPEAIPHGLQDINRMTKEKGMRAGFEYMNKEFIEEDRIAREQMTRPDRKP